MSEPTAKFLACYQKSYGRSYLPQKPDYTKCANGVWQQTGYSAQCARANGHGPHGAYCKQHNPDVVAAKAAAQSAKWKAERDAADRARAIAKLDGEFAADCVAYVRDHVKLWPVAAQMVAEYEAKRNAL